MPRKAVLPRDRSAPASGESVTKRPQPERKGARTLASIPADIRRELNAGRIETRSLVEWLAIDFGTLARASLGDVVGPQAAARIAFDLDAQRGLGIVARTQVAGAALARELGTGAARSRRLRALGAHPSDTVRGWTVYAATIGDAPIARKLDVARAFAADAHSGVRELAWMSVRPAIAAELPRALKLLAEWSRDADPNVRRFASESTRPRGVWCAHIAELRADPELGLPVLEPLRADSSKYVRDSVANWLNDASKDDARFVRAVCARWRRESSSPQTAYVVRRALRTLER